MFVSLFAVSEVLSAPREERIHEEFEREKFLETREAEVLERRSRASTHESLGESREDEVQKKRSSVVEKSPESVNTEDKKTATKKPTVDKPKDNPTSEVNDMTEPHVNRKDENDSLDAETDTKSTKKNSTNAGESTNKVSPEISQGNNNKPAETVIVTTTDSCTTLFSPVILFCLSS